MEHSFWDKYSNLSSPLHNFNPDLKLILALGVVLYINVFGKNFLLLFLIFIFLIFLSKIPVFYVLGRSAVILPFTLLVGIANYVSNTYGLSRLLEIFLKSYLSVIAIILYSSTTKFKDVIHTMRRFKVPEIMVMLVSFLYRYFFVLIDEIYRKRNAVFLRAGSIRMKFVGSAFADIFLRSYQRSEKIYYAMKLRGYKFE